MWIRGEGRTIALITDSIEKVLITKYEVPEGRCYWRWVGVRRRMCGCGLRTHPPAPSQGEGENLLVKDIPLNFRQMNH
jgi:hypothetical protein